MSLILPTFLFATQCVAIALPTPNATFTGLAGLTSKSPSCNDIDRCRQLSSIIWSCLTTVFLCSWVALHPDVPAQDKTGWVDRSKARLTMMVKMLLAPEWHVQLIYDDWRRGCMYTARLSERYPNLRWTETHGMMAAMGGFQVVNDSDPKKRCEDFRDSRYDPCVAAESHFSTIISVSTFELTSEVIEANDSEYDPCAAAESQPSTVISGLTFESASAIETNESPEIEINFSTITEDIIMDKSKGDMVAKLLVVMQTSWFMIQCIVRVAEGFPVTALELTTLGHTVFSSVIYFFWWNKPLDVRHPIMLQTRRKNHDVASELEYRYQRMSWRVRIGSHLPDRIEAWTHMNSISSWLVSAFFAIVSATFGMIHCLGWSSHFLSHAEQILWRISALTVVALPIVALADIATFKRIIRHGRVIQAGKYIYVVARISLFTLSFLALRDLPFAAYQTPSWINLIPHL